ncbi:neutral zinc metallopeptidase [Kribbella sp. NPDC048928]|uniref:neutral zinc metallopeptidase n=1 Tax=Kribbella sp. NPDC048928 TaxID=3364111 RepID=UPI00371749F1
MRKAAVVAALLVMLSGCGRTAVPVAAPPSGWVMPVPVTPTATTAAPRTPTPKPPAVPTTSDTPPDLDSLDDVYLLKNDVYAAGQVPAVPCSLPNVTLRTKKDVQGYSNAIVDCLQRAWKPLVERANVVFTPTRLYAVDEDAKTGCGTFGDANDGFYCPSNTDIYLDWHEYVVGGGSDRTWAQVYLQFVVAHEFGHHVQQLVGIMQYYDGHWAATTGAGAARLEQSRRLELQASCFASAFLGANQTALALRGERLQDYHDAAYGGDDDDKAAPRDHGSRKSSTYWSKAAFKAKSPSACNTWAAPTKRVT